MADTYGYAGCSMDESRQDISSQKRDPVALVYLMTSKSAGNKRAAQSVIVRSCQS